MSESAAKIIHHKLEDETEEDQEVYVVSNQVKSVAKHGSLKRKGFLFLSLILTIIVSFIAYFLIKNRQPPDRLPLPVPPPPTYSEPYSFSYEPTHALPLQFTSKNPLSLEEIKKTGIKEKDYISTLELQAQIYNQNHLSIQIRDAHQQRYEIPNTEPYPHTRNSTQSSSTEDSLFDLEIDREALGFRVRRKSSNEIIFELCEKLVYTDRYLQFTFKTPTKEIYGLGEREGPMQFRPGDYTIFLYDRIGEIDTGQSGRNQQGQHPMYLMKEKSGLYYAFLLRNMSPGEITIREDHTMTWKLIGGILDFNFFMGTDPESALELYHNYIGGWPLPALWHLGYHQNMWLGYVSLEDLENVMIGFLKLEIPLEGVWNDCDYQKNKINFKVDEERFPPKKVEELYAKYDKRYVMLIDSYISKLGLEEESPKVRETLLMHDSQNELCEGEYMRRGTVWLDFLHPECRPFWENKMDQLWSKWAYSGVWLDANEVSNHDLRKGKNFENHLYYDLPYHPGGVHFFDLRIINPDCRHYDGTFELEVRAWNSLFEAQYSFNHLKKLHSSNTSLPDHGAKMFPFVLSRALPMGAGQFVSHWIPDVWSNWESLRASFSNIINDGLFGTPMSGTDICGFIGGQQTAPELCVRWHQVAMFYPFARNSHAPFDNVNGGNHQEPYTYKGKYREEIIRTIKYRYSIMKYLYTQFFLRKRPQSPVSSIHRVGSVLKPLFMLFSRDPSLPPYLDIHNEEQAMFGDSIMIAPVLYNLTSVINVYFPNHRWYDLRFETEVPARGGYSDISAALNEGCPFFLKGGSIFYSQEVAKVLNSKHLGNSFKLTAGLGDWQEVENSKLASSRGQIMAVSDHEEVTVYNSCVLENCIMTIQVEFVDDKLQPTLKMSAKLPKEDDGGIGFTELKVLGLPEQLREYRLASVSDDTVRSHLIESTFQGSTLVLRFHELSFPVDQEYLFTFSKSETGP